MIDAYSLKACIRSFPKLKLLIILQHESLDDMTGAVIR